MLNTNNKNKIYLPKKYSYNETITYITTTAAAADDDDDEFPIHDHKSTTGYKIHHILCTNEYHLMYTGMSID